MEEVLDVLREFVTRWPVLALALLGLVAWLLWLVYEQMGQTRR